MNRNNVSKRETNPRETANIFSFLSFFYTIKLFIKGYTTNLEMDDIYEVVTNCRSKELGDRLEQQWNIEENRTRKPSIIRATWICFGKVFIVLGIIQFSAKVVITIWTPEALSKLVSYFSPGQTDLSKHDAVYYACMVIGLNLFTVFVTNNYTLAAAQLAVRIRAAISSLLYRKSLKLSNESLSQITAGKIITITTKDLDILEIVISSGNDVWIGVLQTGLICYLIYCKIGIASLVGIILFFIVLPIQVLIGKMAYNLKLKCSQKTDTRLELLKEVLSAIKIIKMYTWETFFETKIKSARNEELKHLHRLFYSKVFIIVIGSLCSKIAFFLFLMTYIWFGNNFSVEIIYYILSCFNDLEVSLNETIPLGISNIATMCATMKRVESVLTSTELPQVQAEIDCIEPMITLKNVTVKIQDRKVLNNISLTLTSGLYIVSSPIGSGKTTFLKTLLQEYEFSGDMKIFGKISFASQEPWLFPSTIKNNILFGEKYFADRYEEILRICNLNYDLNILLEGDNTVVADRGINLSRGQQARINLARALYRESDIYLLDDCLAALDAHVSDSIFQECICKFLKNKICIFVTNNSEYSYKADKIIVLKNGILRFGEKKQKQEFSNKTNQLEKNKVQENSNNKQIYYEKKRSGIVPLRDYHQYILHGGGVTLFCVVVGVFIAAQFATSSSEKIFSKWVTLQQNLTNYDLANQSDFQSLNQEKNNLLTLYIVAIMFSILLTLIRFIGFFHFTRKASTSIHKTMVHNIITSTMQFFDSHLIGNVLTRFSKDFVTVDETFPFVIVECIIIMFILFGGVILLLSVHYIFLLEIIVTLIVTCIIKQFCQPTGRNLERLHIQARGPIIGHLSTSLEGLTTIRACKAENKVSDEFDTHQDLFSSALLMVITAYGALQFFLEIICGVFFGSVIVQFLTTDLGASVGDVGLVITQSLMIVNIFASAVRNTADCENLMISVERVLEFTRLTEEDKTGKMLDNWPNNGLIKFDNISLNYNTNKMLSNVSFIIAPKEKLGIVGRTGAGKSSLISALFRLYEIEGTIIIDNVNIKEVSLNLLRSKISVIPQDPYLFTGTVRENLDPLGQYKDEQIWNILKELHLDSLIDNINLQIDKSYNFSAGQKQLLCLARVILRNNKILVLDEATANVDPQTEDFLEEMIKKYFGDCTIITVAHRLLTVLNCHKVVVMSDGKVGEFDDPQKLIKNKSSFFKL